MTLVRAAGADGRSILAIVAKVLILDGMATKKRAPSERPEGNREREPKAKALDGRSTDTDAKPSEATRSDDVVLVHGRSEDGKTLSIVRKRGEQISAGVLRVAEEGKPIQGEVVRLSPRKESPLLCDVDVVHRPGEYSPHAGGSDDIAASDDWAQPAAHGDAAGAGDEPGDPHEGRDRTGPSQVASTAYRSGWDAIWGEPAGSGRKSKRRYDTRLN
jgi:hypothetical protein